MSSARRAAVVLLGAGLLAAGAWAWLRDPAAGARARVAAIQGTLSAGEGTGPGWRTAPRRPALPLARSAARPGVEGESPLGLVLISAARGDGRGVAPEDWPALLAVAAADRPADPLLPVAEALVAIRADRPATVPPGDGPWHAWARLVQAQRTAPDTVGTAALALLSVWPGHPEACAAGLRWGLSRGRLALAEEVGRRCGQDGAVLGRLQGELRDQLGDAPRARAAFSAAGADLHAAAVACQGGAPLAAEDRAALAAPVPPARLHAAWCALAAHDPDAIRTARRALADTPTLDPPFRLARAALALAEGAPVAARAALGTLDTARAEVLRGRSLAQEGDRAGARAAFRAARDQLPHTRAIRDAWRVALPEDGPPTGPLPGGAGDPGDPLLLGLSDPVGDRARPWFLVAGLDSPAACPLCAVAGDLAPALAGPGGSPPARDPWQTPPLSPPEGPGGDLLRAWHARDEDPAGARAEIDRLIPAHPTLRELARLRYAVDSADDAGPP